MKETKPQGGAPSTARAGFDRRVVRPAAGIFVANFTFSAIVAFLPEYSERNGISRPGALFATYAIAVLLVRALTGGYADRVGPARFTVGTMSFGGPRAARAGVRLAPVAVLRGDRCRRQ